MSITYSIFFSMSHSRFRYSVDPHVLYMYVSMLIRYYMQKLFFLILNYSTTGPDGYGSAGFPGTVGDKGEAGEPSRVEGSRGPPGQKGDRGVPGLYPGERELLGFCSTSGH